MYDKESAAALAARVRSLIGQERAQWVDAATELGLATGDVLEIVKHETRYPKSSVLAALVAHYGVEASWLVTGHYDATVHRQVEEEGVSARRIVDELLRDGGRSHSD